ncbi:MAG TPA: PRC-barrel domain-containing protein [Azospirillaceae bacterium]|nr:PRC-barrel domain-containing protein [Azospirillaceae bacterium]
MLRRMSVLALLLSAPALAQQGGQEAQQPRQPTLQQPASQQPASQQPAAQQQARPASPAPTNPAAGQDPAEAARGKGVSIPQQAQASADALVGRTIETFDGSDVGEIHDVVVDGRSGTIRSLIVKMAKAGPLTDKLVEIPYERIRNQPSSTNMQLNVEPAELLKLPQWTPDQLNQGTVAVRGSSGK